MFERRKKSQNETLGGGRGFVQRMFNPEESRTMNNYLHTDASFVNLQVAAFLDYATKALATFAEGFEIWLPVSSSFPIRKRESGPRFFTPATGRSMSPRQRPHMTSLGASA